jgi:hypothetical protein
MTDDLETRIRSRIVKLADEVFDEEAAIDSDGTDQAERSGLMQALVIVEDEFGKEAQRLGIQAKVNLGLTSERAAMREAHAEGLHDEIPREGCPYCEEQ